MKNSEMKALIESLQKTVEVQADTIKALLAMVAQQQPIVLAPVLTQPIITTTPTNPWPPYLPPYISGGSTLINKVECIAYNQVTEGD